MNKVILHLQNRKIHAQLQQVLFDILLSRKYIYNNINNKMYK